MAKEIQASYGTGVTLYALLLDTSGQIYNGTTFEAIADANWATYDIAMSEAGTASGIYTCDMPGIDAGVYTIIIRRQEGGAPAVSDPCVGEGQIHWDGSSEVPIGANVVDILADTGTDGVVLADDAITSGKFDESSAYPLVSADAGATQVARVGADGDTLETLSDQIDTILNRIGAFTGSGINTILGFLKAVMSKAASAPSDVGGTFDPAADSLEAIRDRGDARWGPGIGGTAFTYTLTSSVDGSAIADCWVGAYTDAAMTSLAASGYTDDFGKVTFYLDVGTYYFKRVKSGWSFANPDTEVLS